jgi:hypothetical protein
MKQMSRTEMMSALKRGSTVTLPDGRDGIFLELAKNKGMAIVVVGGLDGPKNAVSLDGLLEATFKE